MSYSTPLVRHQLSRRSLPKYGKIKNTHLTMCLCWCLHPWNQRVDNLWFLSPKTRGPLGNHYLASRSTLDPPLWPNLISTLYTLITPLKIKVDTQNPSTWKETPFTSSSFWGRMWSLQGADQFNTHHSELLTWHWQNLSCSVISNGHFRPCWQEELEPFTWSFSFESTVVPVVTERKHSTFDLLFTL